MYSQGKLTADNYGRDHHPRCFSIWLAGAGIKAGTVIGETDEFSYNITKDPVHVHDLHATVLHMLGIDHEKLTFKYQGPPLPPYGRAWNARSKGNGIEAGPGRISFHHSHTVLIVRCEESCCWPLWLCWSLCTKTCGCGPTER